MASVGSGRVRIFLVAEAVSAVGTFATFVAIWGYAAYEFDAGPGDVALYGAMLTLPAVLLSPLLGSLVDRYGPRAVLGAAKLTGAVASLALLAAHDFRTLALLSLVHGVVGACTIPALQALPPRLVDDADLARTNALVSLTDEIAIVVGPVVGGVAIGWFGFGGAFVVDAATYLLGLAVLPLVRVRPVAGTDAASAPAGLRDALEGLRLVLHRRPARRIVTATAAVHLLYGASLLAEPLYVRDVLERSPSTFAALQAVFGVCLVGGGLVVARLGDRVATMGWVAAGVGASGVAAVIYLGTPSLGVAYLGVALWGACTALLSGPTRTLLQRTTPEALHGRVLASDAMGAATAELIGVTATAALVAAWGVSSAIVLLGALVTATGAWLGHAEAGPGRRTAVEARVVRPVRPAG